MRYNYLNDVGENRVLPLAMVQIWCQITLYKNHKVTDIL